MNDWRALVETEGVALTTPVMKRVFPQGIAQATTETRAEVRTQLSALREEEIHRWEWTRFLLRDVLGYGERLVEGTDGLIFPIPEKRTELAPNMVLIDPTANGGGRHRLLVVEVPHETPFDKPLRSDGNWAATPTERAERLCRDAGVELGLLTDGELLRVIWAGPDGQVGYATWPTEFLGDERDLLSAFVELLGASRFFAVAPENRLDALYRESVTAQQEVTKTLGRQVRQAVELLVNSISRADRADGGRLLAGVEPREVYEAAVTVLMRIVFLLYAEERRLLPLDDPVYNANYAILPLRERLEERARHSEEALAFGYGAWAQVLAASRAVYGGIQHERLRLPPYGGSLFDPDRFPFLERRPRGTRWQETESQPIPVDDLTLLAVLGALQQLKVRGELRSLSFRQLAVEQIGHVYEGLLDHGCLRADEVMVGLAGKEGIEPEIPLARLQAALANGRDALVSFVVEESKLTANKVRSLATAAPTAEDLGALSAACGHDDELTALVRPFLPLLRRDLNGLPMVFPVGSMLVTQTGQRRDSGTAYTTPELADEVVLYALESQVYDPGPAQTADRGEWRLKSSVEILDLKVCDPAVGSGAILVAAVRYLAERLVEAWRTEVDDGQPVRLVDGVLEDDWELMARRAIVDHCIYGVDRNPMAVEMAKLSLWLTTMAHHRPFTFLDHQLRSGDSLLGVTNLDVLRMFHPDPASTESRQQRFFDPREVIEPVVERAFALALDISSIDVRTLRDADRKSRLQRELEHELGPLMCVADALSGAMLASARKEATDLDSHLIALGEQVAAALDSMTNDAVDNLRAATQSLLDIDLPDGNQSRHPLHWPLVFPEVFLTERAGFDAVVGNPPFLGGKRISGAAGSAFREYLVDWIALGQKGSADLVAYFFLRGCVIVSGCGAVSFLATNTISQGDTREVGLDQLLDRGFVIYSAWRSRPWPGDASLEVAHVAMTQREWLGEKILSGRSVPGVTATLAPLSRVLGTPHRLSKNVGQCFIGSALNSDQFILTREEAAELIAADPNNRDVVLPYLNGEDLNSNPRSIASRCVVSFFDRSLDEAERYPLSLELLRERVLPDVTAKGRSYAGWSERWWQFWRIRSELYGAVSGLDDVLAMTIVSKVLKPVFVSAKQVFGHKVCVFAFPDHVTFGLLTSEVHWHWAVRWGSTLGAAPNYSPTDCYQTFPQPVRSRAIAEAGRTLDEHRRGLMIDAGEGLTKTYNRVHDPDNGEPGIVRLRDLHVALDHAVREAYGWDLDLDHGFHQTDQGVRFTLGLGARVEVLDRLLEENLRRHQAEVEAGLVSSDGKKKRRSDRTSSGASLF